jgi:hypothetical protein
MVLTGTEKLFVCLYNRKVVKAYQAVWRLAFSFWLLAFGF